MRTRNLSGLPLCLALMSACRESSRGSVGAPTGPVSNIGISAERIIGSDPAFLLYVSEAAEHADLNGDGDQEDVVAQAFDVRTNRVRNLALAVAVAPDAPPGGGPPDAGPMPVADGEKFAFLVSEASQGADLDGDGSATSDILHVYDMESDRLYNLGVVAITMLHQPSFVGDHVVFVGAKNPSPPPPPGQPLSDLYTLQSYHLSRATRTDTGIKAQMRGAAHEGLVPVRVLEEGLDLNGDGDTGDTVLHLYDPETHALINTGLARHARDHLALGPYWVVAVSEAMQGNQDFTGNGSTMDSALALFDASTGRSQIFRLPYRGSLGVALERRFLLRSSEGGADQNGDGDSEDGMLWFLDPQTGALEALGIASSSFPVVVGPWAAFSVSEPQQGQDLSFDGDLEDSVLHLVDLQTGHIVNQGYAAFASFVVAPYLFLLREEAEAGSDWNEDGDLDDFSTQILDTRTSTLVVPEIEVFSVGGFSSTHVLVPAREQDLGIDVNGDGDMQDLTLSVMRVSDAQLTHLASEVQDGFLIGENEALFLQSESERSGDLNGDGDLDDNVLTRVRFESSQKCPSRSFRA